MILKILFDSSAVSSAFSVGWGFSCLVGGRILFDTGEKTEYLANNIEKMGIDLSLVKAVVISHDHWDHTGGLDTIFQSRPGLHVYICPSFSDELKNKIRLAKSRFIENRNFCAIEDKIYVTGEITGVYKDKAIAEQSLVLRTEKGLSIVTGCAHPGIVEIVEKVKARFPKEPLHMVLGGFHLRHESLERITAIAQRFLELGVEAVSPVHCSGANAFKVFKDLYKEKCYGLKVGSEIEI